MRGSLCGNVFVYMVLGVLGAGSGCRFLVNPEDAADQPDGSVSQEDGGGPDVDAGPESRVTVFREGEKGYMSTVDTRIDRASPDTMNGDGDLAWSFNKQGELNRAGLLRFEQIFGPEDDRVPMGATVLSATLRIVVYDPGNEPPGELREVAIDWDETTIFNDFGPVAGAQVEDYRDEVIVGLPIEIGIYELDVSTSLQRWSEDPTLNLGWIFLPLEEQNNATRIRSSEEGTADERPTLRVTWIP